jgi:hypothetical protein
MIIDIIEKLLKCKENASLFKLDTFFELTIQLDYLLSTKKPASLLVNNKLFMDCFLKMISTM